MKYIKPEDHKENRLETIHNSQKQSHIQPVSSPLYVVAAISNPARFHARYKLYHAFEKMCADAGAILYTVELSLRDRHHEVTEPNNPRHIQLRSPHQLWHKENLLNLGVQRLPHDWEYVAFVDADVSFSRPDWAVETIHQLQHYHIVQMWSHAVDLGPQFQPLQNFESFCYAHHNGTPLPRLVNAKRKAYTAGGHLWHPGYAWAFRRSALSDLGGLGDIGILGSSDHHMACAFVGRVQESIHGSMHENYKKYWKQYQRRADEYIKQNIGYVDGTLFHNWHGGKASRKYVERWNILVDNNFDPEVDILKDVQGLWQLANNKPKLRDGIRKYFLQRDEDSTTI